MSLVQLTLILPLALEEAVIDTLLEHPEWASGFTSMEVSGHGQAMAHATTSEAVLGRARRIRIVVVLAPDAAQQLLDLLKSRYPHPEAAYWTTAIHSFGRFL
jgi:hypothetical protein